MRVRPLGDRSVTAVGSGDVDLARAAVRGLAAGDVALAVCAAIEAGIDVVDCAPDPEAERVVGDAVRALRARDRVVVACRLGTDATRAVPPPRAVQDRVEASLRAVRLDALPLAVIAVRAAWRATAAWPELRGTCERLVHEGKVMRWGASVDEIEDDSAELANEGWLAALRVAFSVCERAAEPVIAAALAAKLAVLAVRPLAGGALAGALGPGVQLPPRDDRRALDVRELEAIAVGVAKLAARVKHVPDAATSCDAARAQLERTPRHGEPECETVAELALRFAVDRGVIALPRLHRTAHVAAAIAAASASPLREQIPPLDD